MNRYKVVKIFSRTTRIDLILLVLFVVSNSGYFFVRAFPYEFLGLWMVYSVQFFLYGWISYRLLRGSSLPMGLVIGVGVLCRIILWFSDPILENDYWRYLWDGRVLAHGINPYLYPPLDHALDALNVPYRQLIGWSKFRTIYPPLAELLFAGTHLIAPDSVLGLKIVLSVFDIATGLLLVRWLVRRGRDPSWSALYFLNPLVLKEIANSAHLDSIVVFLSMASIYLFVERPRFRRASWIALALATGVKLYPLVFLPLFARVDVKRWRHVIIFVSVLAVLYLPFLGAGWKLFGGTQAYAKYWIFNAGVFQLTTMLLNALLSKISLFGHPVLLPGALRNDYPAKVVLGVAFLFGILWRARLLRSEKELPAAALWVLGFLLIISPVVDPWYILWILPLACLEQRVPWLVFCYLGVASYSWLYSRTAAPAFRIAEYGVFFLLLLLERKYLWLGRQGKALVAKTGGDQPMPSS